MVKSSARSLLPALTVQRVVAVRCLPRIANHLHAYLVQFGKDGGEVIRVAAFHGEFAAGHRRRDQECSGFNAVRNNGVLSAVQAADATDADFVRARAFDLGAHLVEQIRKVLHLGLARRVFKDGNPLGKRGRHHEIFGAGHGNRVEIEVCARAGRWPGHSRSRGRN